LAIVQSLLVKSESDIFAIPLSTVVESIRIHPREIQRIGNSEVIKRRDSVLPLVYLNKVLDLNNKDTKIWYKVDQKEDHVELNKRHKRLFVVVIGTGDRKFGIVVDHLLNQQEMVIKPMGALLKQIPCVAGGAILGNGEAVLVLDMAEVEVFVRQQGRQNIAA
jgi:two-component system chemotaxis sensor kinase CheA